ncbi:MAG: cytochrome c [Phycisphaerae bacterium]|nr:MAG: cytochrome c [Phycisphaerae bacterium]
MRNCHKLFQSLAVVLGIASALQFMNPSTAMAMLPAGTTLEDFFMPGTQPGIGKGADLEEPLVGPFEQCVLCHQASSPTPTFDESTAQFDRWASSMMGQSMRDPIFLAALAIAEQDADFAGDFCLRCHSPIGWAEGRVSGAGMTDGSSLIAKDMNGVSCSVCHRLVDPDYKPGVSPAVDSGILASVTGGVPVNPGSGQFVFDPNDRRRGPFDLTADHGGFFPYHDFEISPFHQTSELCATCHDVSNPLYTKQLDGSYALGDLDAAHPTQDKYDQFPIERTYSEWTQSAFALSSIDLDGRFGGNLPAVSTCQDCHMEDTTGDGCRFPPIFTRTDLPQHNFNGANSWVLRAVRQLYPDNDTGLNAQRVDDSVARNESMLARASDMETYVDGDTMTVRIINYSGHKLPTGYGEGRRMWINVKFFDDTDALVTEHGAYDVTTAGLTTGDTKVYEIHHGIDAVMASSTGLPEGESFHFALNNEVLFDNRIPPMGFVNTNFEAVQAEPVAYAYPDGQYWDDTDYTIPPTAVSVEVAVYHQTTSKEYIEFLRDTNTTNSAGTTAYNMWDMFGKSAPVEMDFVSRDLFIAGDGDGDGDVDADDLPAFVDCMSGPDGTPTPADVNWDTQDCLDVYNFDVDTDVDLEDFAALIGSVEP